MNNNNKKIMARNANQFMIIKEMHLIESKLDDFNFPKKQVWNTILLWIKDKDSETYFVMLTMVGYEKRCFEED